VVAAIAVTANPGNNPFALVKLTGMSVSTANLYRIDGAGTETLVRNGDPLTVTAGSATMQDYECPLDTDQYWQARNVSTGAAIVTSSTIQLPSSGNVYLGHPGKPTLNLAVALRGWDPTVRKSRSATFDVIGKRLPVARSFLRAATSGSMTIKVASFADLAAIDALIDDGQPLLLRTPGNPDWGIGAKYISVGDVSVEMPTLPTDGLRWVTVPWTEVDRPAGLAQGGPGFRWADVLSTYGSWADVKAGNALWSNVLDGVP